MILLKISNSEQDLPIKKAPAVKQLALPIKIHP